MSLATGSRIGPYEVTGILGAGGMGEVYEARDTKLNRQVALKILPPAFAQDPDRLARFKREAQVLASLNHPNIAGIHGLEDQGETLALVMELVPGRTLAELISAPMPVGDALPVARQIAAALEAAHEQGVVHRDLKPANIKLTDDGTVKVLDFGLAKALAPNAGRGFSPGSADPEGSAYIESPTMTSPAMTEIGMILGTAGYMAPEQAKGKPVDRRADIWALGVVLFEMLAGKSLYRGETVTETIAHVITQPPAWDALPSTTPAPVRRLLRRCLEKDPRNRMQSAGDVRIDIDEHLASPAVDEALGGGPAAPTTPAWRRALPWIIAGGLLVALAFALWPRSADPVRPVRFDVRVTAGETLPVDLNNDGAVAVLSPDGQTLVYLGSAGNVRRLYARPLDRLESTPIPGTEGAWQHFFSPDGRSIAFFSAGGLMRVPIAGGAPTLIAPAAFARGGTWSADNTIVYTSGTTEGLMRVPASGGAPTVLTTLGPNERTHRWPSFLPDGKTVLFMCQLGAGTYDDGTIEAVRLDTGERRVLVRGGTFPQFVRSGHLVFSRQGALSAVSFDPKTLEVQGEPQIVLSGVLTAGGGVGAGSGNGASQITIATNGTAAYLPSGAQGGQVESPVRLAIVDRTGKVTYEYPEQKLFRDPKFDPDGRRVAARVSEGRADHIHVLDPARGTLTRVTFDGEFSATPIWFKDGQQLAFASSMGAKGLEVYLGRIDGTGGTRAITTGGTIRFPSSFSPDNRLLAIMDSNSRTNLDIAVVSLADGKITSFLNSVDVELSGVFSPDGKWMAYQLLDVSTGASEIFVRAYPDGTALRQVSSAGGEMPYWTKNGRELVYVKDSAVMAVDVALEGNALALGKPRKLFDAGIDKPSTATFYDASADGSRFVLLLTTTTKKAEAPPRTNVTLVFNFFEEIRKATGAGKRP